MVHTEKASPEAVSGMATLDANFSVNQSSHGKAAATPIKIVKTAHFASREKAKTHVNMNIEIGIKTKNTTETK